MAKQYGAPDPAKPQYGAARKDQAPQPKDPDPSPSAQIVQQFHANASVDRRREDVHHTLGAQTTQASPGAHNHDGGDSVLLLDGFTLTGAKASPSTVLPSILNALVRLGAKDSTT